MLLLSPTESLNTAVSYLVIHLFVSVCMRTYHVEAVFSRAEGNRMIHHPFTRVCLKRQHTITNFELRTELRRSIDRSYDNTSIGDVFLLSTLRGGIFEKSATRRNVTDWPPSQSELRTSRMRRASDLWMTTRISCFLRRDSTMANLQTLVCG